jgi:hypothetical protein
MASQIEYAVTIERPVTAVYEYFLDLDRNASDPGVQAASKLPPGPTGPGTEFRFSYAKGPDMALRPLSPLIRRKGRQVWQARFARVKATLEPPTPRRDPARDATA